MNTTTRRHMQCWHTPVPFDSESPKDKANGDRNGVKEENMAPIAEHNECRPVSVSWLVGLIYWGLPNSQSQQGIYNTVPFTITTKQQTYKASVLSVWSKILAHSTKAHVHATKSAFHHCNSAMDQKQSAGNQLGYDAILTVRRRSPNRNWNGLVM